MNARSRKLHRGMRGTRRAVCLRCVAEAAVFRALRLARAAMSSACVARRVTSNEENASGSPNGRLRSRLAVLSSRSQPVGCNRCLQAAP